MSSNDNANLEGSTHVAANFTISEITSFLPLLLAICYIVGWSYSRSYFNGLGIPWAIDVVGGQYFLYSSSFVIPVFVGGGLMLVDDKYINTDIQFKRFGFWFFVFSQFVILTGVMLEFFESSFGIKPVVLLVMAVFSIASLGLEVGRKYKIAKIRRRLYEHADYFIIIMFMMALGLPDMLGKFSSAADFENRKERFSRVEITKGEFWYVVYNSGDKAILMFVDNMNIKKFMSKSPEATNLYSSKKAISYL